MISVFELFKIGIGPSSSHTMGPMLAAAKFAQSLAGTPGFAQVTRVSVVLYGSLAFTGRGHGTDRAVKLGLAGMQPGEADPDEAARILARLESAKILVIGGREIAFDAEHDVVFDFLTKPPSHPNTLAFTAVCSDGREIAQERWCSVGGGFVVPEAEVAAGEIYAEVEGLPYPYRSAADLLEMAHKSGLSIAQMVWENEVFWRPAAEVEAHLDRVLEVMMACVDRGMRTEGILPGGLNVRRRAPALKARLAVAMGQNANPGMAFLDRVSLYAIAVNEENASGSRVVTAPTNGAAGVIPAVLRYFRDECADAGREKMHEFLLTATAIGGLFKMNASISGAEVGCQGEVGVACSMASGGLAAALGASMEQVENAAEIGMEHHLGMTCDPVGGLVQIPCIERNAFGAVKAINAASLAMSGDGAHVVSLDRVIKTMRETGRDMQAKYKETSQGGLALNFTEC